MDAASIFDSESREVRDAMQQIFDKTWKDQWTRDRGRDSKGVPKFEVVAVQRNENPKIWAQYYTFREQLASKIAASGGTEKYDAKTASMVRGQADAVEADRFIERGGLREDVNEFYLLHGTKPSAAKAICDSDFLITKAGSNAGTLYGPGLYFAEASTKSDEYSADDKDGIFANLFGIIVCRVTCGAINYTDEVTPSTQSLVDSVLQKRTHHSILGDREKCRGTYREFIIFDNQQVYPEFVVLYRRID